MSDIVLVTPPDKYYSTEYSFLLIFPSQLVKEQVQELIAQFDVPFTIYMYNLDDNNANIEWLLDTFYKADCVIFDMDNAEPKIRDLAGYFLAKNKTFWLTNGGENHYNTISKNRIYNLDFLTDYIGGKLEKESE